MEDILKGAKNQINGRVSKQQPDFAHGGSGSDTDLILHHNITAVLNHTGPANV